MIFYAKQIHSLFINIRKNHQITLDFLYCLLNNKFAIYLRGYLVS